MKDRIKKAVADNLDAIFEITKYMYENPELGYEEVKSAAKLCEGFRRYGFTVEEGVCDIPTAFTAEFDSGKPGPVVGICAEYDALPDIGHGCGHNLISTMALGAAVGLKEVLPEIGGKVIVFGTPAEETSGAKVTMVEKGVFDVADIAMMAHPCAIPEESGSSLALVPIEFSFTGKAAHASAAPEKGINALDAVIHLFNGINALRQHVPNDIQFHGYISHGGSAPNIVPDFAQAQFYVRGRKKKTVLEAVEKAKSIAHGAELMTGAKVEIKHFEFSYDDLLTNRTLCDVFSANQREMGENVRPPQDGGGSLDLGNVSYAVPCVHGWTGFEDPDLIIHSRDFADRTVSPDGRDMLYRGACTMAMTGLDVITSPELLKKIKEEFEANK